MGNSKKEEGGGREEMDRKKTVGRGWKRKNDVKVKDEKEKEQEEGENNNPFFCHITFLICSHKYKLKNFCLHACAHQSTVTRGSVVD